nr:cohesin subunit psc3 [Quercus suber]
MLVSEIGPGCKPRKGATANSTNIIADDDLSTMACGVNVSRVNYDVDPVQYCCSTVRDELVGPFRLPLIITEALSVLGHASGASQRVPRPIYVISSTLRTATSTPWYKLHGWSRPCGTRDSTLAPIPLSHSGPCGRESVLCDILLQLSTLISGMPGRLLEMAEPSGTVDDTIASTVRSSGRIRRQTEQYAPSPHSSKRKRSNEVDADEREDNDMSAESSDDDEDDEDEDGFEEGRRRQQNKRARQPKRPVVKKPKVNGASLALRPAVKGKKRPLKKAKGVDVAEAEKAGGLFAEIFGRKEELQIVAASWLRRFEQHESAALAEVINFVLKSAGCEETVSEHNIEDVDGVTTVLEDLRDEYQATNPTDYPIIAKGKGTAGFKESVTGFIHVLVKSMHAKDLVYDKPELIENLQVWFSTMSSAPNRSFRHTATAVSLSVVTALCEIVHENAQELANSQRHVETERKKTNINKARVKQLEEKVKQKTNVQDFIESLIKDWFDTVFIHRYRDVDPAIRRDCIAALGSWTVTMPDLFLDGQHLRYMGWVLTDSNAQTRGEVVKQLLDIYSHKDMMSGLKSFTEKFRPRLIEIAVQDGDSANRIMGLELADRLREHGLLEPDDLDAVGRLVFDTEPRIRKAVAGFFVENVHDLYVSKIDDLGGQQALDEGLPEISEDNLSAPRPQWLMIKSLAEQLYAYDTDGELPNDVERSRGDLGLLLHMNNVNTRFSLAADVLADRIDALRDWQLLAAYLLFDHEVKRPETASDDVFAQLKQVSIPEDEEVVILLEVLNASVKHAMDALMDQINPPRNASKSKLSKRQREAIQEELEEAARSLINIIPKLLTRFGDVHRTAAPVLRLGAVLNSPALAALRQDFATASALLDDVKKQFMAHGTDDVLVPASDAILHAKSYGELDDLTEEKIADLWSDVIENLGQLLDPRTITLRGVSPAEDLTALSNNLLRVTRLAQVSDCIPPLEDGSLAAKDDTAGVEYHAAIDYIIALILRAVPTAASTLDDAEAALEDEVSTRAAEAARIFFFWKLHSIITTLSSGTNVGDDDLEATAERRDNYSNNLVAALEARKAGEAVSRSLIGSLLDLYSTAVALKEVQLQPGLKDLYLVLVMDMDAAMHRQILCVFSAAEATYAKHAGKSLSRSKSKPAAPDADDADHDADDSPVDDDPLSDPESDVEGLDADPDDPQASQARRERKMLDAIYAEQHLCTLTGQIVRASLLGVVDARAMRRRLERHKTRLGPNFKECVAFFDAGGKTTAKAKRSNAAKLEKRPNKVAPKSNAIVADDEEDDQIEEDEESAEEDEEERRARQHAAEEAREPEDDDQMANGDEEDGESVLGD